MKKIHLLATSLLLTIMIHAQTQTFDIATFIPPAGWQRTDSGSYIVFHDTKDNNGQVSFCQIHLYPSHKSSGKPAKDFSSAWNELVVKSTQVTKKPKTATEKTPDGWTIVTGSMNFTVQGLNFTCMLLTVSGFDKTMPIMVNVTGGEYTETITTFLQNLNLDSKGMPSAQGNQSQTNTTILTGSLDQYSFTAPQDWQAQKGNGYISYRQPLSASGQGCVLTVLSPQPSSGNLEKDVKSIFSQMYPGWRFYYSDQRHDDLMKGYTKQGLEYCIIEASMVRTRPGGEQWDYETGAALVIDMGNQMAVATLRHEPIGIYCRCKQRYDYWGKFFNSFTIKNSTPPKGSSDNSLSRIIGKWQISGNRTIGDYIFAGNGHYQYISGYGSYSRISPGIIELKTSAFQGDGTYTIKGDQLLIKRKSATTPETYRFRFEKINQGSTGWKDRIHLLNEKPADNGFPYEACYEKIPIE